jgi:hypothetical protein
VPDRYGHLFLDELDRLADRLDDAHRRAVATPTRPNGDADVAQSAKVLVRGGELACERGIRTPTGCPTGT